MAPNMDGHSPCMVSADGHSAFDCWDLEATASTAVCGLSGDGAEPRLAEQEDSELFARLAKIAQGTELESPPQGPTEGTLSPGSAEVTTDASPCAYVPVPDASRALSWQSKLDLEARLRGEMCNLLKRNEVLDREHASLEHRFKDAQRVLASCLQETSRSEQSARARFEADDDSSAFRANVRGTLRQAGTRTAELTRKLREGTRHQTSLVGELLEAVAVQRELQSEQDVERSLTWQQYARVLTSFTRHARQPDLRASRGSQQFWDASASLRQEMLRSNVEQARLQREALFQAHRVVEIEKEMKQEESVALHCQRLHEQLREAEFHAAGSGLTLGRRRGSNLPVSAQPLGGAGWSSDGIECAAHRGITDPVFDAMPHIRTAHAWHATFEDGRNEFGQVSVRFSQAQDACHAQYQQLVGLREALSVCLSEFDRVQEHLDDAQEREQALATEVEKLEEERIQATTLDASVRELRQELAVQRQASAAKEEAHERVLAELQSRWTCFRRNVRAEVKPKVAPPRSGAPQQDLELGHLTMERRAQGGGVAGAPNLLPVPFDVDAPGGSVWSNDIRQPSRVPIPRLQLEQIPSSSSGDSGLSNARWEREMSGHWHRFDDADAAVLEAAHEEAAQGEVQVQLGDQLGKVDFSTMTLRSRSGRMTPIRRIDSGFDRPAKKYGAGVGLDEESESEHPCGA